MIAQASWHIPHVDLAAARDLARQLDVGPLVAEILVRRGFTDADEARAFLHPDFRVYNPFLLPGMTEARGRIDRALGKGERIAVYGDYDADGITATFLMVESLRLLGGDVIWRLPNRLSEGYGVSAEAVESLAAEGAKLLITVDCGVGAREQVELARRLGVDVVVTDHHQPVGELPDCIIVNPRLGGYPFPHLAGVGVALKVAQALYQQTDGDRVELPLALRPYVDVVAVGTVADVVPLHDENRTLVAMGLGRLRSAPRPGLAALLEVSGSDPASVDATTIAYRLAPRLNAAGRLEDATPALELLWAADRAAALPLAQRLGELNTARQDLEARAVREALAMVPDPVPAAVVLSSPDWHEGVVGIVASRVVDKINRPAIMLSEADGVAKGSGRSIPAFDLLAAVEACSESLLGFGGHRAACGVRLRSDDIDRFRKAFVSHAAAALDGADLRRLTAVDAIVSGDDLTLALADELQLFEPHGVGNPRVSLLLHGAEVLRPRLTRGGKHLQCDVRHDGVTRAAIRFGFNDRESLTEEKRYDLPAVLTRNSYSGVVSAQLQLKGGEVTETAASDHCPTACTLECPDRLAGDALFAAFQTITLPQPAAGPAALAELAQKGRLIDHRRRPVVSTLAALAGAGGRMLVLVADVGRRRPLLSRDLYLPQVIDSHVYLNGACAAARLDVALGAGSTAATAVVMASTVTAALHPSLVASFDRVAFVDPPFHESFLHRVVESLAPGAELHVVWGDDAVHFTQRVAAADYDLEAACRHLYRALNGTGGASATDVADRVLAGGGGLVKLPALAAAWQTLDETGLLVVEPGKKTTTTATRARARRVAGRIDLHGSVTYRLWHERFVKSPYLQNCLSASL